MDGGGGEWSRGGFIFPQAFSFLFFWIREKIGGGRGGAGREKRGPPPFRRKKGGIGGSPPRPRPCVPRYGRPPQKKNPSRRQRRREEKRKGGDNECCCMLTIVSKPGRGRRRAGRIDRSKNENGQFAHTMSVVFRRKRERARSCHLMHIIMYHSGAGDGGRWSRDGRYITSLSLCNDTITT
jgi:hypothetical protein